MLRDPDGALSCIDHGARLFLGRALSGRDADDASLPCGHVFPELGRDVASSAPSMDWSALLDDAPEAWLSASGATRVELAAALAAYAERAGRALA